MDKVRVGFIGCGGIAQYHFGHMEKTSKARVVAVCDKIADRAEAAAKRFQAKPYTVYADMLDKEKLDAVFVCVEPSAHDGMELMAIEKGLHLFVQKPMSLSMAYARKVRAALAKAKRISAVGFQCRYVDTLPRVKAWLAGEQIGMVSCFRLGGLPMVWWWRQRRHSGGQVIEQTIHNYDVLRYLLGEVTAVSGMAREGIVTGVPDYDTEDASAVTMHFKSGVVATMTTGCFSPAGFGNGDFLVYTREGQMTYGLGGAFKIQKKDLLIEGKAGNDYGQECDEAFLDAILENDQDLVLSPYADACKSLELVIGATESMRRGGELIALTGK
ncbi:MAG: Gfo/Idh/MocA family oxidoreductase [Lentisphaerae bacterium]|nr:Gfo/Idh/MocA family oxidoreductase [Lentisphaerota bacterium]